MVAFEFDPEASNVAFPDNLKFRSVEVALLPVYWSVPPAKTNLEPPVLAGFPKGPFDVLLDR
jgi:hypothetical protein